MRKILQLRASERGLLDQLLDREAETLSEEASHAQGPSQPRLRAVEKTQSLSTITKGLLRAADLPVVLSLFTLTLALALWCGVAFGQWFLGLALLLAVHYLVYAYFVQRRSAEQQRYAVDLPTMLLAMAANMKIGLPAYAAMERSTKLLSKDNALRAETERFLHAVHNGTAYHVAIQDFGAHVQLEELALFRKAFALVVEHGGRFAPTLERLAQLSRERALLVQTLRARTSGMRMTANALLLLTPLIVLMLAARIDNFWHILHTNTVAHFLGVLGATMIFMGCAALRQMGSAKV